jgi:hypothetical protein
MLPMASSRPVFCTSGSRRWDGIGGENGGGNGDLIYFLDNNLSFGISLSGGYQSRIVSLFFK